MLISTVTYNEGGHERQGMKSSLPVCSPEVSEKVASYWASATQSLESKSTFGYGVIEILNSRAHHSVSVLGSAL